MTQPFDLIIIGTGPAGLSAALYAGRYMVRAVAIGKSFGGEAGRAGKIWNYPGVKEIDGLDLALVMREQAESVGSMIVDDTVESVTNENGCFVVKAGEAEYSAKALIVAQGAERKHLGIINENELHGRGVHYCITCDAPLYAGKTIAVVGGRDASVKGVNLAAEYAKKVFLIVRGKEIVAEPMHLDAMKQLGEKVEVLYETEVSEINGGAHIESVRLSKPYDGSTTLPLDALFIEIGAQPSKVVPTSLGVKCDESGYIIVDPMMQTNVAGVFAAGDATAFFGRFKQNITAAAMGAVAATSAYHFIQAHPHVCEVHWKETGGRN